MLDQMGRSRQRSEWPPVVARPLLDSEYDGFPIGSPAARHLGGRRHSQLDPTCDTIGTSRSSNGAKKAAGDNTISITVLMRGILASAQLAIDMRSLGDWIPFFLPFLVSDCIAWEY